jgi:hypothetical protein
MNARTSRRSRRASRRLRIPDQGTKPPWRFEELLPTLRTGSRAQTREGRPPPRGAGLELTTGAALTAVTDLFIRAGLPLSRVTITTGEWLARAPEDSGLIS